MSLEYEPASEPLHIHIKRMFLNWELPEAKLAKRVPASEQTGKYLKDFKDFPLKAKARIWP